MQLAFITPTAFLEKYAAQGDIYLALAHLIDDEGKNHYATFHRKEAARGKRVILDNGLFEGSQVSTEQLIARASAIRPDVVCAPDVLFDSKNTTKAFKQFIRAKHDAGLVCKVMGIPQADNEQDWWDSFFFFQTNPDCNMIGLSILSIPESFGSKFNDSVKITCSRIEVINQLYRFQEVGGHKLKPMHLLGLGSAHGDIFCANSLLPNTIISNDSSSAFVHGMYGVTYDRFAAVPGGKITEKLDFNIDWVLHHKEIQENIDRALQFKNRRGMIG